MATYKGIRGITVQSLASDLTASSTTEGQLWYNSTLGKFKVVVQGTGAWASSTAINTARGQGGGMGSATAAVFVGGVAGPGPLSLFSLTEEWNGSAWSEVNNMPSGDKNLAAGGILTAGWVTGGDTTPDGSPPFSLVTFEYDGTSWTTGGDLNLGRYGLMGSGPQTAAFVAGGPPSLAGLGQSETYDGTSWTPEANLTTARASFAATGNSTTGLIFGGYPPYTAKTESWNGTSWTEVNSLNLARSRLGYGGGTSPGTQGLAVAGYNSPVIPTQVQTEVYDGTSWTEVADLATGRSGGGLATTGKTSALYFGGDNPTSTYHTNSEEWTAGIVVETVTTS